ncbi:MAG: hypothetical protein H0V30_04050 [Chitinophagaceae bacterium]|nr:hypothetical protein [Chitinophagaceae bacterium]
MADTIFDKQVDGEYYDEVAITLHVPRIGSLEIQALIIGQQLYLPINELFDFLKIRNIVSPDFDLVQGFFVYPKDNYFIDKTNNRIVYRYNNYALNPGDLIRTESNLYLKSDYFGKVFGLECVFNFRSLTVTLNTKIELPAIREMKLEIMRRNISKLKGERKADTIIQRNFPLFHVGMADWSVISSHQTNRRTSTRGYLGIGAIAAGGELNLGLNYFSDEKINLRQQFYQWRYVNNDNSAMKQATAGKVFAQSVASVFAPVIGVQFSNTPTTYRRSFGTYILSNTTEPEWTVELYVNNILVNYTKTDASGFYSFEVPMVYGNSIVKLRFYGPWGEERTSEKFITVPFNFIPLGQFEYNVTGGVVENNEKSRYAKANLNYGLGSWITIGGGMEYLSSIANLKTMPFVNASMRVGSHLLFSAEHNYGVRSKLTASYRLPSNLQVDVNYTKYVPGQTAIRNNYFSEKKIVLSMPFRSNKLTAFSRFTLNQFIFPNDNSLLKEKQKNTSAELLFSAVIKNISSNLTTFAVLGSQGNPLVYTNLSFTFRLPKGLRFTPQAQYEYKQKKLSSVRAVVEKNIFNRGFINLAYEKTLVNNNLSSATIGLRYNFSFAQTFFSATRNRNAVASTQLVSGSFLYDGKSNYLGTGNQTNVGKGGFIISPFLDLNCNGKRDAGEPKAYGLKLRVRSGRIEHNIKDTSIRITGLEANTNYFIELDKSGFDNVAWQLKHQTISVTVEPNNFKLIEVAVAVAGEVSGTVYYNNGKTKNGLGRIIVNIFDTNNMLVAKTITEEDGYFSYMGLAPGKYTSGIDAVQMKKLSMKSSSSTFTILQNIDGDVVEGLEIVVVDDGK